MKNGKQNFKILTKTETNKVKGGGSFFDWMKSMYASYEASQMEATGADCPPPEPPDDI